MRRHAAAGLLLAGWVAGAAAEPFVPADDALVLETLPFTGDPAFESARRLTRELEASPADADLAVAVARAWLRLGRAQGDPRLVGRAAAALAAWDHQTAVPAALLVARAAVLQAQHDHAAALAQLDQAVAVEPANVQAHMERATVLENLGEPGKARRACVQVARLHPGLLGEACLASAESLGGSAASAYATLLRAREVLPEDDPSIRGWASTVLGDIAVRQGRLDEGERHYRDALGESGRDVYVLSALADLYLDAGRPDEVLVLTEGEERLDPLLLRRAIAMRAVHPTDAAPLVAELGSRFDALRQRRDEGHLRDAARFALVLADRPGEALALALGNWARQRAPADARITLEAALAADEPDAARPVLEWMAATGIEDVTLRLLARRLDAAS